MCCFLIQFLWTHCWDAVPCKISENHCWWPVMMKIWKKRVYRTTFCSQSFNMYVCEFVLFQMTAVCECFLFLARFWDTLKHWYFQYAHLYTVLVFIRLAHYWIMCAQCEAISNNSLNPIGFNAIILTHHTSNEIQSRSQNSSKIQRDPFSSV